jgi:hypothetical protein
MEFIREPLTTSEEFLEVLTHFAEFIMSLATLYLVKEFHQMRTVNEYDAM